MDLDISEVARRSGLPVSTLRFYEEKGLVSSTGRRGLRRRFAPSVLDRLALITLARSAGFSPAEIARLFPPEPSNASSTRRPAPPAGTGPLSSARPPATGRLPLTPAEARELTARDVTRLSLG